MRLVVDTENDVRVVHESTGKFGPEFLELSGGGCIGVGSVTDDL